MIRIETTVEFDADGRFSGRIEEPVSPGRHQVVIQVSENVHDTSVASAEPEIAVEPAVKQLGDLLVFTGQLCVDVDEFRRQLDDDRAFHLLYGPFE